MLSIVIPVCNVEDATNECISNLVHYAKEPLDIIIIDNASVDPYSNPHVRVIRNEKNVGFWPSMLQGIAMAESNIILCMHNDVFIWEESYDTRIKAHFAQDLKLAVAGFFGGRGVGIDGGRGHPEGNMLGRKYGTPQNLHGSIQTDTHPAVVFDSLAMIFNRELLYSIDYIDIPPHHWTDRLITFRLVTAGYHALTIGIAFDHGGAFTSSKTTMNTFTEDWCAEKGLPLLENWDFTLYHYGLNKFQEEFRSVMRDSSQLWVKEGFDYIGVNR